MLAPLCFKQARRLSDEWFGCDHRLREIVLHAIEQKIWPARVPFVVTCIKRTRAENVAAKAKTRIHVTPGIGKHRALDARARNMPEAKARKIERNINFWWHYDSTRPRLRVCILHKDPKSGVLHFHFQVHPRTERRIVLLDRRWIPRD